MNTTMLLEQHDRRAKASYAPEADYILNVGLVYQDSLTRARAEEVHDLIAERTGGGAVKSTEWKIGNLREPSNFTRGIQALAKADAIVIAIHEADRLPGEFYLWVNLWLQVRKGKPGALVALVGSSGEQSAELMETRTYLHAVANQGGLEFFMKAYNARNPTTRFDPNDLMPLLTAA